MKFTFGVDVGGTTVKLGFFTEEGELLEKWEIPTRKELKGSQILPDIAQAITDKLSENRMTVADLNGVGMGVPGPVDQNGIVQKCVNLKWGVIDAAGELSNLLGVPVKVENDANVAALGEAWKGAGEGVSSSIMVTLGTGVGGGLIYDGKIFSGSHGAAGEIGHICVNAQETRKCNCGKYGCLEQYCSATGIVRMTNRALLENKDASPLRKRKRLSAKAIFTALGEGDPLANAIVNQVGDTLGKALAGITCTFDPERIVIGGGVSNAGKPLINAIKAGYRKYAFHATKKTEIVKASLGNNAGIYGAAALICKN
ncbi:MAG: ROK family glucokinase [Lachnospiraceae bacterium]|nr:ROK family glucokinase [Lachnospiraceae bacterium]